MELEVFVIFLYVSFYFKVQNLKDEVECVELETFFNISFMLFFFISRSKIQRMKL